MMLSRALNAAVTHASELVMLRGNVVLPINDIQLAKIISQLLAKKVIASCLMSLDERVSLADEVVPAARERPDIQSIVGNLPSAPGV